jgi:hypothetical protein
MNMNVPILPVPQPADALAKISELMNRLPFGDLSEARRAEITRNALGPVILLIEAVQLAAAAGQDEESVFIQFVRSIYAQAEIAKREQHLALLFEKLQACRPGGPAAGGSQSPGAMQ